MKIKLEILKKTEKRDTGINKERKTNNDLDCLRNDQLNFSQIGLVRLKSIHFELDMIWILDFILDFIHFINPFREICLRYSA